MDYKVTITDVATLKECIEFVSFKVESPPDDYKGKSYHFNSMTIEGKIGTDEKALPLYQWSLIPSTDPNCYKEITVEQTHEDQLIRRVTFSKAFVVDYSESHIEKAGEGYFSLYVRQFTGDDIECSDGSLKETPNKDDTYYKIFNSVKPAFDYQIMEGRAGKPPDFEITMEGVRAELSKSKIGRETLEYIDKNNVGVMLSYKPMVRYNEKGEKYEILGRYNGFLDVCEIFVTNTLFYPDTAKTIIHEITHYMGYQKTKYFEFLARYREEKHVYEGKVPLSVMREHYKTTFKSGEYDNNKLGMPNGKRKRLEKKGLIKSVERQKN